MKTVEIDSIYQRSRLVPETDVEKDLLRHTIEMALWRMGQWHSVGNTHTMRLRLDTDATVDDDGFITGSLLCDPMEFDPAQLLTASHWEPARYWVEHHRTGAIKPMWQCGADSNCIEPNCWVVRKIE